jgi:hypothetical protein
MVSEERLDLPWAAHLFGSRSLNHPLNSRSSTRTDYFHNYLIFLRTCEVLFFETVVADRIFQALPANDTRFASSD